MMPRFTVERVRLSLATSFPTANAAVKLLGDLGIVVEMIVIDADGNQVLPDHMEDVLTMVGIGSRAMRQVEDFRFSVA